MSYYKVIAILIAWLISFGASAAGLYHEIDPTQVGKRLQSKNDIVVALQTILRLNDQYPVLTKDKKHILWDYCVADTASPYANIGIVGSQEAVNGMGHICRMSGPLSYPNQKDMFGKDVKVLTSGARMPFGFIPADPNNTSNSTIRISSDPGFALGSAVSFMDASGNYPIEGWYSWEPEAVVNDNIVATDILSEEYKVNTYEAAVHSMYIVVDVFPVPAGKKLQGTIDVPNPVGSSTLFTRINIKTNYPVGSKSTIIAHLDIYGRFTFDYGKYILPKSFTRLDTKGKVCPNIIYRHTDKNDYVVNCSVSLLNRLSSLKKRASWGTFDSYNPPK